MAANAASLEVNRNNIVALVAGEGAQIVNGKILVDANGDPIFQSGKGLYSKIVQNSQEITTKVSNGEIASTINQTAQGVLIQASKINLSGYVTASQLEAANARIDNLVSGTTRANLLATNGLIVYTSLSINSAANFFVSGSAASWQSATVKGSDGNDVTIRYLGR